MTLLRVSGVSGKQNTSLSEVYAPFGLTPGHTALCVSPQRRCWSMRSGGLGELGLGVGPGGGVDYLSTLHKAAVCLGPVYVVAPNGICVGVCVEKKDSRFS